MVTAMRTGVSFQEFHAQVPEITASAQEALRTLNDSSKRKRIGEFTNALIDAHEIWRYKISEDESKLKLTDVGGHYIRTYLSTPISESWDTDLDPLVKKYDLAIGDPSERAITNYGRSSELDIDMAIQKIFAYAATQFRELDTAE